MIRKSKAEGFYALSLFLHENFASVKKASSWLTALLLQVYGFALHKSTFQDALALRYSWFPLRSPSLCACGSSFSVEYVLSCPKGGLPSLRHNDIRDLNASLLTEIYFQVIVEPELQPVSNPDEYFLSTSNTQDGARLDIVMDGFWVGQSEKFLVDDSMSMISILVLRQISAHYCLLPIKSMRTSNGVFMANVYS